MHFSKMSAKIKCAEYSYVTRHIWDLTEEEEKAMMTLPPAKIMIVEPKPEKKYELLKCLTLQNLVEKDGTMQQRFRFLACVVVSNGRGSFGIGEKVANSRLLAESKARAVADKNFRFIGKKITRTVEGKCQDVTVIIEPTLKGGAGGGKGSPLAKKLLELIGLTEYAISGSDNTLSCIRAIDKALRKIK